MKPQCAEEGCIWKPKYLDPNTGLTYCGVRSRQLPQGTARQMDAALRAGGTQVGITEDPEVLKVQALLEAHAETCSLCRAERTWTVREMAEGRVNTEADIKRVGKHAIEHACAYGGRLRMALGLAMLGRPAPLPQPDS
jgi:hypothetical protein